mmetsp:Transcript_18192/g.31949  ORF Transcript_18192/g.31949 Transcript_18192/m.31949 type:complete len:200 (-) Transcript_18192:113-712(-)
MWMQSWGCRAARRAAPFNKCLVIDRTSRPPPYGKYKWFRVGPAQSSWHACPRAISSRLLQPAVDLWPAFTRSSARRRAKPSSKVTWYRAEFARPSRASKTASQQAAPSASITSGRSRNWTGGLLQPSAMSSSLSVSLENFSTSHTTGSSERSSGAMGSSESPSVTVAHSDDSSTHASSSSSRAAPASIASTLNVTSAGF